MDEIGNILIGVGVILYLIMLHVRLIMVETVLRGMVDDKLEEIEAKHP